MKYQLHTYYKKMLADTLTPVNIYLKLRDVFAASILLESSDYHGNENSLSLICCEPIASFTVLNNVVMQRLPDGTVSKQQIIPADKDLAKRLEDFKNLFDLHTADERFRSLGLFGYTSFDAVRYFEDVKIDNSKSDIPDMVYKLFRYVIVVDHFHNDLRLHEFVYGDQPETLGRIEQIIFSNRFSTFRFQSEGTETTNYTDAEFLDLAEKGKQHCYRGDVFQIVLSRRFVNSFQGDEFNVYRALRSINPSPYLFYFDFGNFKLFGSSPEAQLQVKNNHAYIYPIAGTFRRSGNDKEDASLAEKLSADEKENAEHVMLVDLARNDMSRSAAEVKVEVFKEIQFYSHVIHLVSKVSGKLNRQSSGVQLLADTFPAGTLSGAPKVMAMNLINRYENVNRSFYGGAIGLLSFDGSLNQAIMIRTFLSKNNKLTYQAGAGIVSKSNNQNELQEVNNKLEALRKAIKLAETI
ncbi:MAG: anthranilate synthase component I family protein [Bacteroidetes bacterium]|nr:anthranilate synthase component I family protein [Bacteroidota bacterium]MBS1539540.1 anthranilate synthase component I family protein [Bacteroidota bacterium]